MLVLLLTGCSNTAYLARDEKLYTGADLQVKALGDVPNQDEIEDQLEQLAAPAPNAKFLGLFRLKLWLYNIGFFKQSLGEPPVLLSAVAPGRIAYRMRTLLHNKGFFDASVSYQVREEEKTAGVDYAVEIQPPYTINSITVSGGRSPLLDAIRALMPGSLVSPGKPYDLDSLSLERSRIDAALKDRGFFYFSPDFLLFEADSSVGGRKAGPLSHRERRDPEAGPADLFHRRYYRLLRLRPPARQYGDGPAGYGPRGRVHLYRLGPEIRPGGNPALDLLQEGPAVQPDKPRSDAE